MTAGAAMLLPQFEKSIASLRRQKEFLAYIYENGERKMWGIETYAADNPSEELMEPALEMIKAIDDAMEAASS